MNKLRATLLALVVGLLPLAAQSGAAPSVSAPLLGSVTGRIRMPVIEVRPVGGLHDFLGSDGKLHLRLGDYMKLVLANSTPILELELNPLQAWTGMLASHAPFDPSLGLGWGTTRTVSPEANQTNGASTLSSLSQDSTLAYSQLLASGQQLSVSFNGDRLSNNDIFNTFNPSLDMGLNLELTQPLWRNRGDLQNRAPILEAQAQYLVVTDQTQTSIADQLVTAADQYWNTVQARDQVAVSQAALDLVQQSDARDQKSLDLGALAPGDIFTDEAQVAQDQVALLQAQSQYRQQLDLLRRQVGADLDPATRNLDIVLEDDPSAVTPEPPVQSVDDAAAAALARRPEIAAAERQLQSDNLSAAAARDNLRPQLNLAGQYGSASLAGTAVNGSSVLGVTGSGLVSNGLGSALSQLLRFGFPAYGFQLQFSLPIRSSAASAALGNARIAQANQQYAIRAERQQVIQDVRLADTQLRMAVAEVQSAATARDLSQKNVDSEQQKYTLGSITQFELLQSQVQLSNAQSTLLGAYTQYQQALIAYERATWTLLDKLHIQLQ